MILDSMPPMPPVYIFYIVRSQYENTPCGGSVLVREAAFSPVCKKMSTDETV